MAAGMMRAVFAAILFALAALPGHAQQRASTAGSGVVRVLDKITGKVEDLTLRSGEVRDLGLLAVRMVECRYPRNNPSGDAFINLVLTYQGQDLPVFSGWMIASAPALNPLDHPRFDVWALRCVTS